MGFSVVTMMLEALYSLTEHQFCAAGAAMEYCVRFPGSKSASCLMQASASRSPALLDCAAAVAADAGLVVALQDQLPGHPEQEQPWQQKHLGCR